MPSEVDLTDPDNPEWTVEDFARGLGPESLSDVERAAFPKSRGRPRVAEPKLAVSLRLSPAVVRHFRDGGKGWQAKINDVLEAVIASQDNGQDTRAELRSRGVRGWRAGEGIDHLHAERCEMPNISRQDCQPVAAPRRGDNNVG